MTATPALDAGVVLPGWGAWRGSTRRARLAPSPRPRSAAIPRFPDSQIPRSFRLSLPAMTGRRRRETFCCFYEGRRLFAKIDAKLSVASRAFFRLGQCAGSSVAGLFVGRMGVGRSWGWAIRSECFFCSWFLGARKSGPKNVFFSQAAPDPFDVSAISFIVGNAAGRGFSGFFSVDL